MKENIRTLLDNILFVLITLTIIIGGGYFAWSKITDVRFPIKGKVVFESNRFEYDPEIPMSNRGVCIYENGKVEKIFKDVFNPRWSKDREKIVGSTAHDKKPDITFIDMSERKKERKITKYDGSKFSWFPDDKKVIFDGTIAKDYRTENIYIYDIDTGEETQLTNFEKNASFINSVDVSPDGKKIIFSKSKTFIGEDHIHIMDVETKEIEELSFEAMGGRWHPDGKQIVYIGKWKDEKTGKESSQIMIYNTETKQQTVVTRDDEMKVEPIWSPDGKQIMFVQWELTRGGGKTLQVINADGTNKRQIIGPGYDITDIDWVE